MKTLETMIENALIRNGALSERYSDTAKKADPDAAVLLADVLLRIYEADRTGNCGAVNGEAVLCQSFRNQAEHALICAGVLEPTP